MITFYWMTSAAKQPPKIASFSTSMLKLITLPLSNRLWWCAFLVSSTLLLSSCGKTPEVIALNGGTMGTYYQIKYLHHPRLPAAARVQDTIEQQLERINALMSTYRADSELSRLNQSQEINQPFPLAPETMTVIREAVRLHQLSEGALDITLGPLVNLWGFGPPPVAHERVPSAGDLAQRRGWTGMDKLSLMPTSVIKTIPQLSLDLSGIAKGFAVDQLAAYLASLEIKHFLVNIGGEIRVQGRHQAHPWRIAIEHPADSKQPVLQVITPGDQAVATSGDYRNYFEQDGVRYSHTLDPRTGSPITHSLISVTVLHPSCMTADGLATALNVLGPEKALAIANQRQIPLLMLIKTPEGFSQCHSEAFKPYLNNQRPLS